MDIIALCIVFVIIAVIIAIAGSALPVKNSFQHRKRLRRQYKYFKEAGRLLKIKYAKGDSFVIPAAGDAVGDSHIRIKNFTEGDIEYLKFEITYAGTAAGAFRISNKTKFDTLNAITGMERIEPGDDDFNNALTVRASRPETMLSLLCSGARDDMLRLVKKSCRLDISEKNIAAVNEAYYFESAENIAGTVRLLLSLRKALTREGDTRKRLIDNMNSETHAEVRVRTIRALISDFPVDDEIRSVLNESLNDRSDSVKIEAARHLGERGMAYLVGMLGDRADLRDDDAADIVKILTENMHEAGIPVLRKIFGTTGSMTLLKEILRAFASFGDESLNDVLTDRLSRDEDEIRIDIIDALGRCGRVSTVEMLAGLASSSMNPFVKRAAQKSINRIQARLGGVEEGWLSIAEASGAEGALSMTDAAGDGALSIDLRPGDDAGDKKDREGDD